LQVTPHIHNSDLVTLEILEERSSLATTPASTGNANDIVGPTTNKSSTKTTIHVPNGYFVIISGILEDDETYTASQVPCLGTLPFVGAAFSDKGTTTAKRNVLLFLRPVIIDTDDEFQDVTRHQQDVWKFERKMPKEWVQDIEGALDFFNLRRTLNTDDEDDPACHRFLH
jgi:type III secretion protein C